MFLSLPHLNMSSAPASLPTPSSAHSGDSQFMAYMGCAKTTPVGNLNNKVPSSVINRPIMNMNSPITKYLDMTNIKTFTKPVPGVKNLCVGNGEVSAMKWAKPGEDTVKITEPVKNVGKVTTV